MRKGFFKYLLIVVALFAISCSKEKNFASEIPLDEKVDTVSTLIKTGIFTSGPYGMVSGKVELYKRAAKFEVRLVNFSSTNGPALHVYLSKEPMPVNYKDLGRLKSTVGNQVYRVLGMPDFAEFKYISIHCVDYNHLFGSALINQ